MGMVLAHQYLGQLDGRLQEAFAANTSIKLAGGVSAKDARSLAPMLQATPEMIEAQPKGSFAAYVRGVTTAGVSLRFPMGYLEKRPRMTGVERAHLRAAMRERYAVHHTALEKSERPETADKAEKTDDAPVSAKKPEPPPPPNDVDVSPGTDW